MSRERWAGLGLLLLAGGALAVASGSESWLGLVPCALCLWERVPYRFLLGIGVLAVLLPPRWARWLLRVGVVVALAGVAVGVVHVGVEQGWWPSPLPECAAPSLGGGSFAERLARMPEAPAKPCDEPTYLLPFLPVSMAAMNTLLALALAAGLAIPAFAPISIPRPTSRRDA